MISAAPATHYKDNFKYGWIVFMVVAAVVTFAGCIDMYKDIRATGWPTTAGIISRRINPSRPHNDPFAGPLTGPLLTAEISFSFKVDGVQYASNNKSFGFTFSDHFEVSDGADKDFATVKVYFNPRDPREAVLIPGPKTFSICLIALGAMSIVYSMKQMIHKKNA